MTTQLLVTCPSCRTRLKLNAPDEFSGRLRVRCTSCQSIFAVRGPSAAPGSGSSATLLRPDAASAPSRAAPPGSSESLLSTPPEESRSQPAGSLALRSMLAGRFRILRFIARGGMGEVYEAEDLELRERVALKTVRTEGVTDAFAVDRFKREIQLARKVTHPNVCRINDVFRHRDEETGRELTFLTMELLRGETLADCIERLGPFSVAEALPIVRQLVDGLQAAHRAGVVHRDFKSRNVMLEAAADGPRAVITDFGLARGNAAIDAFGAALTVTDGVLGTPAYMAPEQVEGGEITAAVDIYALGVVLYEMLTGEVPFKGESPISTAVQRLRQPPPSPRVHVPDLDGRWESVILGCLKLRPEERFARAADVTEALTAPDYLGPTEKLGRRQSPAPVVASAPSPAPIPTSVPPAAEALAPAAARPPAAGATAAGATGASSGRSAAGRWRERLVAAGLVVLIALIGLFIWRQVQQRLGEDEVTGPGLAAGDLRLRNTVAVIGLRDLAGQPETSWLATALSEMLAAELSLGDDIRVIDGESVVRMKKDLQLADLATLAPDTLSYARSLLGADYLVLGSYLVQGPEDERQLRVDLNLQDARRGETVATHSATGSPQDLFDLVGRLGPELRGDLGLGSLPAERSGALRQLMPSSSDAARLYSEGLDRLRDFDARGGQELLEQVVALEPDNAMAWSALAGAWASLGYEARARGAAERAYSLAGQLPREEALWVEARYRELAGDWQQAVGLYRTLWSAFPDDPEYGLQLASAQVAAGEAREALGTVEMLRSLPGPAAEDPRLDVAEAQAAGALGQSERQRAAAARASERSRQRGSRLLLARARITEAWALRNLGRPQEAREACEEAERLYREAGDPAGTALAVTQRANLLFDQGELEAARQLFEEAEAVYQQAGDEAALARTRNNLALVSKQQGDLDRAEQLYQQSLELCRKIENQALEAYVLNNLGSLAMRRGRLTEAASRFTEALEIRRRRGDKSGEAAGLDNLAGVQRREGRLDEARQGHERALALHRETGQRLGESASLRQLGLVLLRQGRLGEARERLQQALNLSREAGNRTAEAAAAHGLGEVLRAQGDLVGARKLHEEALAIRGDVGQEGYEAESQLSLAAITLEEGGAGGARDLALEAAEEFRRESLDDQLAETLALVARTWLAEGDVAEARQVLAEATALAAATENLETRLPVELTTARLAAAQGRTAEALRSLDALLTAQGEGGFQGLTYEARLLRGEILLAGRNPQQGRTALEELEAQAREAGYELLAQKAAERLR